MKKPAIEALVLDQLFGAEGNGMSPEEQLEHLRVLRQNAEVSGQLDRALLERLTNSQRGLDEARLHHRRLKEMLDKMTMTPWYPATLVQVCDTVGGPRAVVQLGNTRRVVGFAPGVDAGVLSVGCEVFLGSELNVITAKSPNATPRGGETAAFVRQTEDGRLILRSREEEMVMDPAGSLKAAALTAGDLLRCDRSVWIAFERIERANSDHLFLEETPQTSFAEIGGLGPQIERVKRALNLHVFHAETAVRYGLRRKGSILLVGPSGTGKTMIARALANWLATLSPGGRSRFMNIKPSQLHSMWYSQSEANYREVFRLARAAGAANPQIPIVMFFDEMDSIGLARGQAHAHVDDRVLTAFMTELDGLSLRGNIVVIGATNRRSALDPALLRPGRMGDLVLEIARPKRPAAREIFAKHLRPEVPFARNGHGDDWATTREEILEAAVSRIYAPNGDSELATLQFRDGKRRPVRAADLVSGALIANIVASAIERACVREVETGERGLRFADVEDSLTEEFDGAVKALTPANCRHHLTDLPQDMDVVSLQPVARKARGNSVHANHGAQVP